MSTVVVTSGGGIKGAVAAGRYAREHELILLHVNYGQRSAQAERRALEAIGSAFPSTQVYFADAATARPARSAESPAAGRSARSIVVNPQTETVAPLAGASLRSVLPLSLAMGLQAAMRHSAELLVTGVSRICDAGHLGLPGMDGAEDTRREFVHAYNLAVESLLRPKTTVRIESPWMDLSYAEILKLAARFRVPLELTWTCDRAGPRPCGQCDPCRARDAAFTEAGLPDPALATA